VRHTGVCAIHDSGAGRLTPFGRVTFTTAIVADDNQPPCGTRSQRVNRIIRTVHTTQWAKLAVGPARTMTP
jgi:hypothetical protein